MFWVFDNVSDGSIQDAVVIVIRRPMTIAMCAPYQSHTLFTVITLDFKGL